MAKLTDYQLAMAAAADNGWTVAWNAYNDRRQRVVRLTKGDAALNLYFSWLGRFTSVSQSGTWSGCPSTGKRDWLLARLAR